MNTTYMDPPQQNLSLMNSNNTSSSQFHHDQQEYAYAPTSTTGASFTLPSSSEDYSPTLSPFHQENYRHNHQGQHHQQQHQFINQPTFSNNAFYLQHDEDSMIDSPLVSSSIGISSSLTLPPPISTTTSSSTTTTMASYNHSSHTEHHHQVRLTSHPYKRPDSSSPPPPPPRSSQPSMTQPSQLIRWAQRPKFATSFWEDESTLCYQVDANGICVARRQGKKSVAHYIYQT